MKMKRRRDFLANYCTITDLEIYFAELFILSLTSIAEILERLPTQVHKDFQDQRDFKLE